MIIKGVAASQGTFTGIVKIYSPDAVFTSQDILVAPSTTPDMCVQMLQAGAIITEHGGLLSHAAIFCREIKKPCIVGVKDLFNQINDGDTVTVNAVDGEIIK